MEDRGTPQCLGPLGVSSAFQDLANNPKLPGQTNPGAVGCKQEIQANGIWSVRRGKKLTTNTRDRRLPPPQCERPLRYRPMRRRSLHHPGYTSQGPITSTMVGAAIPTPSNPRYHIIASFPVFSTRRHLLHHRPLRATQRPHFPASRSSISRITIPSKISACPTRLLTRLLPAFRLLVQALSSSKHCNELSVKSLPALLLLYLCYFENRTVIRSMFI